MVLEFWYSGSEYLIGEPEAEGGNSYELMTLIPLS